jgi:hypothetical protein
VEADMSDKNKSRFLESMFKESEAYSSMDMIESYIEKGLDLKNVPLQPLYAAIKSLNPEIAASHLGLMSKKQRVTFLDLDLWSRDNLDTAEFEYWVKTYSCSEDEALKAEFSSSVEFLLFLKGRFNIWTFDVEDPMYPDHDYYFLSDDSLLLFEYDETFELVDEVKEHIRDLYSRMGVELAYTYLFKLVADGALSMMEEEYQFKKSRLADAGFVDYYDALDIDQTFAVIGQIENYVRAKKVSTARIDQFGKQQILPRNALTPFKNETLSFDSELEKVSDEVRKQFLRFNFLRLINGSIALAGSYRAGSVAINRIGQKIKNHLELGFSYIKDHGVKEGLCTLEDDMSLFDLFDFTDLYRLGNSLVQVELKALKKDLKKCNFEDDDNFLGAHISEFLDNSFSQTPMVSYGIHHKGELIVNYDLYSIWVGQVAFIRSFLPFIEKFSSSFKLLKDEGTVLDHYYYNYNVSDIDLEAILMSSYANFRLGHLTKGGSQMPKLGVMLAEFKAFCKLEVDSAGNILSKNETMKHLELFKKSFGLESINHFEVYLFDLLQSQLEGYQYGDLEDKDFMHVGGPIIFVGA